MKINSKKLKKKAERFRGNAEDKLIRSLLDKALDDSEKEKAKRTRKGKTG